MFCDLYFIISDMMYFIYGVCSFCVVLWSEIMLYYLIVHFSLIYSLMRFYYIQIDKSTLKCLTFLLVLVTALLPACLICSIFKRHFITVVALIVAVHHFIMYLILL